MKKILILIVFATQACFAQSVFPINGGNVGIGTITPNSKLSIRSGRAGVSIHPGSGTNSYYGSIAFNRECVTGEIFDNSAYAFQINNGGNIYDKNLHFQIYNGNGVQVTGDALVINGASGGNIGVGTSEPSALLDIYSPLPIVGSYDTQKWSTSNAGYNLKLQTIWNTSGINQEFIQRFNGVDYRSLVFYQGNVGIGTSNPTNKLDVNGTIHSQEVKVDMNGWSDFVFKKEYNLPTLEEVEKYIAEKGHLENIPSEEEILKNGINVGEMNAKLLQKIEELTLYMIDMKKENEEMKRDILKLKHN
ncbi:hypothetical protein [Flavobacterium pectinovorum]|jgi:hypothetical protein|uniref:Cell wall anchor protein n=1 Tax=Flavobacterium pectinovorum TaxID=29533 RepID=A0A502EIH5_9FLAO|nr:hypothetical protein [Flavobacterium pectinovorum]TPG36290.1 hypothetical protein EAH81_19655 [Flavobacterium pectinovorum]